MLTLRPTQESSKVEDFKDRRTDLQENLEKEKRMKKRKKLRGKLLGIEKHLEGAAGKLEASQTAVSGI